MLLKRVLGQESRSTEFLVPLWSKSLAFFGPVFSVVNKQKELNFWWSLGLFLNQVNANLVGAPWYVVWSSTYFSFPSVLSFCRVHEIKFLFCILILYSFLSIFFSLQHFSLLHFFYWLPLFGYSNTSHWPQLEKKKKTHAVNVNYLSPWQKISFKKPKSQQQINNKNSAASSSAFFWCTKHRKREAACSVWETQTRLWPGHQLLFHLHKVGISLFPNARPLRGQERRWWKRSKNVGKVC